MPRDRLAPFSLDEAMRALGLRPRDVQALMGADRSTVWRWRKAGRCPLYVRTVMAQQARIRSLALASAG